MTHCWTLFKTLSLSQFLQNSAFQQTRGWVALTWILVTLEGPLSLYVGLCTQYKIHSHLILQIQISIHFQPFHFLCIHCWVEPSLLLSSLKLWITHSVTQYLLGDAMFQLHQRYVLYSRLKAQSGDLCTISKLMDLLTHTHTWPGLSKTILLKYKFITESIYIWVNIDVQKNSDNGKKNWGVTEFLEEVADDWWRKKGGFWGRLFREFSLLQLAVWGIEYLGEILKVKTGWQQPREIWQHLWPDRTTRDLLRRSS